MSYKNSFLVITVLLLWNSCSSSDDCGMMDGPCYGKNIHVNTDTINFSDSILTSTGIIGITAVSKSSTDLNPVVVSIDKDRNLLWAVELDCDSSCEIPVDKICCLSSIKDGPEKSIRFFNESYSEPGLIYLTDDLQFSYVCLLPM